MSARISDIVVMGVTGCGKTTVGLALAKRLGWHYIEGDAFHSNANRQKMASGIALDDADRWPWLDALVDELNSGHAHCVLSCSALKLKYRDRLRRSPRPTRLVWLNGDESVIAERLNARRGHYMPPSLLRSQLDALEPPLESERVLALDIEQTTAALVDAIIERLQLSA